jgi:hypothetical protein
MPFPGLVEVFEALLLMVYQFHLALLFNSLMVKAAMDIS